jgi:hypothetical protein
VTPFHPFPVSILHRCCNTHARGRLLFWALLLMSQLVFFMLFSFVRLLYRPEAVQVAARLHLQHLHSSRLVRSLLRFTAETNSSPHTCYLNTSFFFFAFVCSCLTPGDVSVCVGAFLPKATSASSLAELFPLAPK